MLRATRLALCAALLSTAHGCHAVGGPDLPPSLVRPDPARRVEAWRADLAHLAGELAARHIAPFRVLPEADYWRSVADLHARIPALDDDGVVIEMARLAASIGDGHTGFFLYGARLGIPSGPLWLLSFEDGIFVKGVVGDLGADVLDLRLVRVGGVEVTAALERLAPLIPRDNATGIQLTGPGYLNMPRLLHAVGLSDRSDGARYVFASEDGIEVELVCEALSPGTPAVFAVRYAPGVPGAPLAERMRARLYSFERVGNDVLLQYNACRDDPAESFSRFCTRAFAELDRDPPRRLVIDLRWNTGGNSNHTRALYRELRRRPQLTENGRLRVLIGRATVSSGMWAALNLAVEFDAELIGEPSGGTPNAPGHRGVIVLPHSKLDCGYARRLWRKGGERYPGPALPPDVLVRETSTQHFAGRDPAFEAALTTPP